MNPRQGRTAQHHRTHKEKDKSFDFSYDHRKQVMSSSDFLLFRSVARQAKQNQLTQPTPTNSLIPSHPERDQIMPLPATPNNSPRLPTSDLKPIHSPRNLCKIYYIKFARKCKQFISSFIFFCYKTYVSKKLRNSFAFC